jgi:hypothetical protein
MDLTCNKSYKIKFQRILINTDKRETKEAYLLGKNQLFSQALLILQLNKYSTYNRLYLMCFCDE